VSQLLYVTNDVLRPKRRFKCPCHRQSRLLLSLERNHGGKKDICLPRVNVICHSITVVKYVSVLAHAKYFYDVRSCFKKFPKSSVAFGMRSEANAPKNGERTVCLSFMTMLQLTSRVLSRISLQRTMWQHWSIPKTLLTWFQLIFICSQLWNWHWRDGAFMALLK